MSNDDDLYKYEGDITSLLRQSDAILADMPELASIAAALNQEKAVASKALKAQKNLRNLRNLADGSLKEITAARNRFPQQGPSQGGSGTHEQLQELADDITERLGASIVDASRIKQELVEILDEHDYIKMLLNSRGKATVEQMDVLAFPKTNTAKTNVLTINGEAGSGKTLCLLAKLIRDVKADQASFSNEYQKQALFVCFNKSLASSISSILDECLREFPFAKQRITVQSFDKLINSLVSANGNFIDHAADVRFKRSDRMHIHYETAKGNCKFKLTRQAMRLTAKRYPGERKEYYLNDANDSDVEWMSEEIRWLQSRFSFSDKAQEYIDGCERTGRGSKHQPRPDKRKIIVEVWREYEKALERSRLYTIEGAINRLLTSNQLPKFDVIAVDECQDLSMASVNLLLKMRKGSSTLVYIAGDENQKIYSRDFNWKSLDGITARTTKTLKGNHRNSEAIASFANRLLGMRPSSPRSNEGVYVGTWTDYALLKIIEKSNRIGETIAVIGNSSLCAKAEDLKLKAEKLGILSAKGLEFDNVIVDYRATYSNTLEEEKRLRYVHFSRARKRLYIRYHEPTPELLSSIYDDYITQKEHEWK